MINRPQNSQEEFRERNGFWIPICAHDMYSDVIMRQHKNDKLPRAAWYSFKSSEMEQLRRLLEEFTAVSVCVCEICQLDEEIHDLKVKKDDILAAIQECKKMLRDNRILSVTN